VLFEVSSAIGRCVESGIFFASTSPEGRAKSAHGFKTSSLGFKTVSSFGTLCSVTMRNACFPRVQSQRHQLPRLQYLRIVEASEVEGSHSLWQIAYRFLTFRCAA